MNVKLKTAILAAVVLLAALVLYFPNLQEFLSPGEEVTEEVAAEETVADETEEAVFAADDNPLRQALNALEAGRPVLIKFYARW